MIRKHVENDLSHTVNTWHASFNLTHLFLLPAFVENVDTDRKKLYTLKTRVYKNDKEIAEFIGIIEDEIVRLLVLPQNHSLGIGTELVKFLIEFYGNVEIEVFERNKIGKAFFNDYGFKLLKKFTREESGEKLLRL